MSRRGIVAAAAICAAFSSVAYELLLASYASFLLGASAFQYAFVFSLMMFSMGVGALFAQRVRGSVLHWMIAAETVLAFAACSALPFLYWLFAVQGPAQTLVLVFVALFGLALGMELPLLNRMERGNKWLSEILFWDYLGGFIGGLLFPLWLLPHLGFFRLGALLGCLNALLALAFAWQSKTLWLRFAALGVLAFTVCAYAVAEPLRVWMENHYFGIPG